MMWWICAEADGRTEKAAPSEIILPAPSYDGAVSVERALFNRRSIRAYSNTPLTLKEVSQLLWAGGGQNIDGLTGATRTYPSAGGLYPVELILVAADVDGMAAGVYRYDRKNHSVSLVKKGDFMSSIKAATGSHAFGQATVPACIVATAVYSRTSQKYGKRGRERYVPMDMGGCGENVFLQATALGLGTFIIGAFDDSLIQRIIEASTDETPLYIMPVGHR